MAPEGEVTPREGRLDRVEKDQDKLSLEKKSNIPVKPPARLHHIFGFYLSYLLYIYYCNTTHTYKCCCIKPHVCPYYM